jgi:hypothetical protein
VTGIAAARAIAQAKKKLGAEAPKVYIKPNFFRRAISS